MAIQLMPSSVLVDLTGSSAIYLQQVVRNASALSSSHEISLRARHDEFLVRRALKSIERQEEKGEEDKNGNKLEDENKKGRLKRRRLRREATYNTNLTSDEVHPVRQSDNSANNYGVVDHTYYQDIDYENESPPHYNPQQHPYSSGHSIGRKYNQHKNKKPVYVTISQQTVNGLLSLLLLFIVSVCGCIGAIFIMSALTVIESLQTRGNCYLVSLALAHLLVTLLVIPSSAIQIMAGEGINGRLLCHYQWLTLEFSLIVSQLSFLLIAADNYLGYKSSEKVTTTSDLASESLLQSQSQNHLHPKQQHQQLSILPNTTNINNSSNLVVANNEQPPTVPSTLPLLPGSSTQAQQALAQPTWEDSIHPTTTTTLTTTTTAMPREHQHQQTSLMSKQSLANETNPMSWLVSLISDRQVARLLPCSASRQQTTTTTTTTSTSTSTTMAKQMTDKQQQKLRLAHQFAGQKEAILEGPGCLSYRNCCGRLKVLFWILLVWLVAFVYTLHQHELSYGPKFCTVSPSNKQQQQQQSTTIATTTSSSSPAPAAIATNPSLQRPIHNRLAYRESTRQTSSGEAGRDEEEAEVSAEVELARAARGFNRTRRMVESSSLAAAAAVAVATSSLQADQLIENTTATYTTIATSGQYGSKVVVVMEKFGGNYRLDDGDLKIDRSSKLPASGNPLEWSTTKGFRDTATEVNHSNANGALLLSRFEEHDSRGGNTGKSNLDVDELSIGGLHAPQVRWNRTVSTHQARTKTQLGDFSVNSTIVSESDGTRSNGEISTSRSVEIGGSSSRTPLNEPATDGKRNELDKETNKERLHYSGLEYASSASRIVSDSGSGSSSSSSSSRGTVNQKDGLLAFDLVSPMHNGGNGGGGHVYQSEALPLAAAAAALNGGGPTFTFTSIQSGANKRQEWAKLNEELPTGAAVRPAAEVEVETQASAKGNDNGEDNAVDNNEKSKKQEIGIRETNSRTHCDSCHRNKLHERRLIGESLAKRCNDNCDSNSDDDDDNNRYGEYEYDDDDHNKRPFNVNGNGGGGRRQLFVGSQAQVVHELELVQQPTSTITTTGGGGGVMKGSNKQSTLDSLLPTLAPTNPSLEPEPNQAKAQEAIDPSSVDSYFLPSLLHLKTPAKWKSQQLANDIKLPLLSKTPNWQVNKNAASSLKKRSSSADQQRRASTTIATTATTTYSAPIRLRRYQNYHWPTTRVAAGTEEPLVSGDGESQARLELVARSLGYGDGVVDLHHHYQGDGGSKALDLMNNNNVDGMQIVARTLAAAAPHSQLQQQPSSPSSRRRLAGGSLEINKGLAHSFNGASHTLSGQLKLNKVSPPANDVVDAEEEDDDNIGGASTTTAFFTTTTTSQQQQPPPTQPGAQQQYNNHSQLTVNQLMINNSTSTNKNNDNQIRSVRPRFYWFMLISTIVVPSLASTILFARAYLKMKEFKMRPYKPMPMAAVNTALPTLLMPHSPLPLVAQRQIYTFPATEEESVGLESRREKPPPPTLPLLPPLPAPLQTVTPNEPSKCQLEEPQLLDDCDLDAGAGNQETITANEATATKTSSSNNNTMMLFEWPTTTTTNHKSSPDNGFSEDHSRRSVSQPGGSGGGGSVYMMGQHPSGEALPMHHHHQHLQQQLSIPLAAEPDCQPLSAANTTTATATIQTTSTTIASTQFSSSLPHQQQSQRHQQVNQVMSAPSGYDQFLLQQQQQQQQHHHQQQQHLYLQQNYAVRLSPQPDAAGYSSSSQTRRLSPIAIGQVGSLLVPRVSAGSIHRDTSFSAPPSATFRQLDHPSGEDMFSCVNMEQPPPSSSNCVPDEQAYAGNGDQVSQQQQQQSTQQQQQNTQQQQHHSGGRRYEFRRRQHHAQSFHYGTSIRQYVHDDGRPLALPAENQATRLIELSQQQQQQQQQQHHHHQHIYNEANSFRQTSRHHLSPMDSAAQHQQHLLERHRSLPRSSRLYQSESGQPHLIMDSGGDRQPIVAPPSEQVRYEQLSRQHHRRNHHRHAQQQSSIGAQINEANTSSEIGYKNGIEDIAVRGGSQKDAIDQQQSSNTNAITATSSSAATTNTAAIVSTALANVIKSIDESSSPSMSTSTAAAATELNIKLHGGQKDHHNSIHEQLQPSAIDTTTTTTIANRSQPQKPLWADTVVSNNNNKAARSSGTTNENKVILCTYSYMTDDQLLKSNIIVFILNLTLWLPFILLSIAAQYRDHLTQELKDGVWWMATLNCCSCSYVYALTNKDFREAFNKLFYYCCCKSHVTFQRKTPIFRRQLDVDSKGNLRIHIIPGLNIYSNKLSKGGDPHLTSHSMSGGGGGGSIGIGGGHTTGIYGSHHYTGGGLAHANSSSPSHHYSSSGAHDTFMGASSANTGLSHHRHHMSVGGGFGGPLFASTKSYSASHHQFDSGSGRASGRTYGRSSERGYRSGRPSGNLPSDL